MSKTERDWETKKRWEKYQRKCKMRFSKTPGFSPFAKSFFEVPETVILFFSFLSCLLFSFPLQRLFNIYCLRKNSRIAFIIRIEYNRNTIQELVNQILLLGMQWKSILKLICINLMPSLDWTSMSCLLSPPKLITYWIHFIWIDLNLFTHLTQ